MALPFSELGWEHFEGFVRELVALLPGVVSVSGYGSSGSDQRGIDLTSEHDDGSHRAYQCKVRATPLRARDIEKIIDATEYPADGYLLVISNVASPAVRDRMRSEPAWSVWDADDLSRLTRTVQIEHARRLVDRYFGKPWRKVFLGAAASELFISAEEMFAPFLEEERLFNHAWPMLGRENELAELLDAAESDRVDCVSVVGRGGLGKSRLLREVASRLDARGSRVLFLAEQPVTPEGVDDLVLGPVVVVVDDAHKRDDLEPLLAALARREQPATILLATRPQRIDELRGLAARTGNDPARARTVELHDLKLDDVEELARQALGPNMRQFADRLAAVTRDSPLVTLVGGRLLAQKHVLPDALASDSLFRAEVLSRFQEEVVGNLGPAVDADTARRILRLVSAIGPAHLDDDQLVTAATEFVGTDRATLIETIGRLEAAGVLVRRGRRFRISPDTLADHILREACLTASGIPTGYADDLFGKFFAHAPNQVLRNLAELDWRASAAADADTRLLDRIWIQIHRAFAAASNRSRIALLSVLRESAYYQPAQLLDLVELAISSPSERPDVPHRFLPPSTHQQVLDSLPALLREIAHSPEYLDKTAELLWALGADDMRPTNSWPDHPIRVLAEIAAYSGVKPIAYNELVLESIEKILDQPEVHQHRHSPIELLEPLLAREGISSFARGHQIRLGRFIVPVERTMELRRRVRAHLERLTLAPELAVSVRALRALTEATHEPHGAFGEGPPKAERDGWLPEQLEILDQLERISAAARDPLLHVNLISDIRWHREGSTWKTVRKRVADLLASIPDTPDFRLTGALVNQWDVEWLPDTRDARFDFDKRMRELRKVQQAVANNLLVAEAGRGSLFTYLNDRIRELEPTGVQVNPYSVLYELAQLDTGTAERFGEAMIQRPDEPLSRSLGAILQAVRLSDRQGAQRLAERALETGHRGLAWSVAASLRGVEWPNPPDESELATLGRLIHHDDPGVRAAAVDAVPFLAQRHPRRAKELLLAVDVTDNVPLAETVLRAFNPHVGFDYSALTKQDLRALLRKIARLDRIDGYETSEFLDHAATRVPSDVVTLLLKRLSRCKERDDVHTDYVPLPYEAFHHPLDGLRASPTYAGDLRRIRQRAYRARPGMIHFWLPKLFALVSAGIDATALAVLDEWVVDTEPAKLRAVGALLRDAPRSFVFTQTDFVTRLLETASRAGRDTYDRIVSDLYGSATQGIRHGTPGQPYPEDVAMRDSAAAMAERFRDQPAVRDFYEAIVKHADSSIERSLLDDEDFEYNG